MAKIRVIKCACKHCGTINEFDVYAALEMERQVTGRAQPPDPAPGEENTKKAEEPKKKRRKKNA